MENVHLKVENLTGNTLVLLEGEAPKPINTARVNYLGGDINAVRDFIMHREKHNCVVSRDNTTIIFTEKTRNILLITEEHLASQGGITVDSTLSENERLLEFGINRDKKFTLKELVKVIEMNIDYFPDEDEQRKLVGQLRSFTMKATTEIQESMADGKGNKSNSLKKQVESDIVSRIKMQAPIFRGTALASFWVDVCFDTSDSGVKFWLDSVELYQTSMKELNAQFSAQKQFFADEKGFTVISK